MQKVDEEITRIVQDFRAWYMWWCDLEGDCPITPSEVLREASRLRSCRDDRLTRKVLFAIEYFFNWLRPDAYEERTALSRVISGEFEQDEIMHACIDYLWGLQLQVLETRSGK